MLFEIFHLVHAFTPSAEHLDKFILPAKYVYILCLKFLFTSSIITFTHMNMKKSILVIHRQDANDPLTKQLVKAFRELSGHTDVVFPICCLVAKPH